METHLSHHLPGIVMTQLTVKENIPHLAGLSNVLQHPPDVGLHQTKRRAAFHLATMTILAPFGTPSRATGLLLGPLWT
jgi:hypothetical protein